MIIHNSIRGGRVLGKDATKTVGKHPNILGRQEVPIKNFLQWQLPEMHWREIDKSNRIVNWPSTSTKKYNIFIVRLYFVSFPTQHGKGSSKHRSRLFTAASVLIDAFVVFTTLDYTRRWRKTGGKGSKLQNNPLIRHSHV